MSHTTLSLQLAALSALLMAVGCASTSTTPATPPPEKPAAEQRAGASHAPSPGESLAPVYFGTDSALLPSEARANLKRYARTILDNPDWGVLTIDGHCDARGSQEYNLALGQRRAEVVRRYLMDLGVPAERLDTRTFGEERPAVMGDGESAWRYNRRSEIREKVLRSARHP